MICTKCAQAADDRLPVTSHCGTRGNKNSHCNCQHRTERYRLSTAHETQPGVPVSTGAE